MILTNYKLTQALERFCEGVFPTNIYCLCCGSAINNTRIYGLCDNCIDKFRWVSDRTCAKCGKILANTAMPRKLCNDCQVYDRNFDKGFTCAQYGLYERALIMDLKYRDRSYVGTALGKLMAERIEVEELEVDAIIPVPISKKRMEQRGYNQAEIMAKPVARRLGIPLVTDVLERSSSTVALKDLGRDARMEMVKNAFAINAKNHEKIIAKKIILLDDIITTGATLDACSSVLKQGGADTIYALTFAAGADGRRPGETPE